MDVRVIAATNRDLRQDVAAGRFRADLFYRLSVFPIDLPPLRARLDDIPMLAEHFMARAARRLGRPLHRIAPETLAKLLAHSWPGNIRDLQNVIERAAILSPGGELRVDWELEPAPRNCLTLASGAAGNDPAGASAADHAAAAAPLSLHELERQHFITVLRRTGGVIEGPHGAARLLSLNPSTARFRIKKLGILKEHYLREG
jgi:transcriptional regulator with GAF, ATPase, and Fis domain